jgi:hypothetical protein
VLNSATKRGREMKAKEKSTKQARKRGKGNINPENTETSCAPLYIYFPGGVLPL